MTTRIADTTAGGEPRAGRSAAPGWPAAHAGIGGDDFRTLMRHHPTGVALITADPGDGPVALTATSLVSLSADPPLIAFSLSELSSATPSLRRSSTFVIHLLSEEELELARLGATSGVDRFADSSSWARLETGEPYFVRPSVRMRAQAANSLSAGTSVLVVAHVLDAVMAVSPQRKPLVYLGRTWFAFGDDAKVG
ncbi:flavin reductase family protein [Amycolatopsis sp. NPDC051758]|uniref:flavin reductase family protein n=1 Tax=Amycolatopsis sp. NPDC051758 TaxID=3363935 RepID=UPI0037B6EF19